MSIVNFLRDQIKSSYLVDKILFDACELNHIENNMKVYTHYFYDYNNYDDDEYYENLENLNRKHEGVTDDGANIHSSKLYNNELYREFIKNIDINYIHD